MRTGRRPLGRGMLIGALLVSILACQRQADSADWAPGLSEAAQDTLLRWLLCDDCDSTLLANAASLQNRAVPALRNVLFGPPESWRTTARTRAALVATRTGRQGDDSIALVASSVRRFDASVQRRGVVVLGRIGTPQALEVLRDAIAAAGDRAFRSDVVRGLYEALGEASNPRFTGRLSDTTPRFLDTVRVAPDPATAWTGDENIVLHGAPFPDSLVVIRWGRDSLAFVAAGETGRYALSVTSPDGTRPLHSVITIGGYPAPPQADARAVFDVALPLTILRSLSRTLTTADTLHAYRFPPGPSRTIRATLDWRGPAQLHLSWRDCLGASVPGAERRISGTVVDENGVGMNGAQVNLQGTLLASVTSPGGAFELTGVPPGWEGMLRVTRIGYQPATQPAGEGRAGYWLQLTPAAGAPPSAAATQTSDGTSPRTLAVTIPAGACRLLTIAKQDSTVPAVIARLGLTIP